MAEDRHPWERGQVSKDETREIMRAAKHKVLGELELRKTREGYRQWVTHRMAQLAARNQDGMRRSPQSAAEWRAWIDFKLGTYERRHMDLHDIIVQLTAVAEEVQTTSREVAAVSSTLDEAKAAAEAARQRGETALSTLKAAVGEPIPESLEQAVRILAESDESLTEAVGALANAHQAAEDHAGALDEAAEEINNYIAALIG